MARSHCEYNLIIIFGWIIVCITEFWTNLQPIYLMNYFAFESITFSIRTRPLWKRVGFVLVDFCIQFRLLNATYCRPSQSVSVFLCVVYLYYPHLCISYNWFWFLYFCGDIITLHAKWRRDDSVQDERWKSDKTLEFREPLRVTNLFSIWELCVRVCVYLTGAAHIRFFVSTILK